MSFHFSSEGRPLCAILATTSAQEAAEILQDYLSRITGTFFDIYTGEGRIPSHLSIIRFIQTDAYSHTGFAYAITEDGLCFSGASSETFVYAVYDFLERIIGCRYYTSTAEYIPQNTDLSADFEPYSFIPLIDYREIYYKDFEDRGFARKHKAAQSKVHEGWGFWCHSFQFLLPSKDYFEEHPEYFALLNGKRHPAGEPCLSNPEVRRIMLENLRKFIAEKPECRYWSISQNDDNNYCQCEACKAMDDYDESPMGSVLNFVNYIADEVPDKVISTLSYWYTRKPPKHTRPHSNVHIMTCNIEAGRGLPIEIDPSCKESKEELEFWANISDHVSLWDYNIQFRNLVSPFPNLRTLAPNMQFFAKNKVKLLFSQCNREIGGEFSELRGYLLAKLAWDPYCNVEAHMEDFCKGYYKEASPYILEYIKCLHDAQDKFGKRLDIFGGPQDAKKTFLTQKLVQHYDKLFAMAKEAISYDKELLLRTETAYLPVLYAAIVLQYGSRNKRLERINQFARIARATGLKMVEEWKITVDQFVTDALAEL